MNKLMSIAALALLFACSNASQFVDLDTTRTHSTETREFNQMHLVTPKLGDSESYELRIKPERFTVRASGDPIQFKIFLGDGLTLEDVALRIEGSGADVGSIDETGIYAPPEHSDELQDVTVIAELLDDDIIVKSFGKINPSNATFLRCEDADDVYPISGLLYFINEDADRLPDFSELLPDDNICMDEIALSQRRMENEVPDLPPRGEGFALDITSKILIPKTGRYYFGINSTDGSKVYINDSEIIDNDGIHREREMGTNLDLTKGFHKIRVQYFHGSRDRIALELFWVLPGSNIKETIPRENFFLLDRS